MGYHNADELNSLGQRILQHAASTVQKHLQDEYDTWLKVDQKYNVPDSGGKDPLPGVPSDSQIQGYINSEYGDIPSLFGSYGNADPAHCQPMEDTMWEVATALDPTMSLKIVSDDSGMSSPPVPPPSWGLNGSISDRVTNMTNRLSDWTGMAAYSFKTDFVGHISEVASAHEALAASLALVQRAHQKIRTSANTDIWNIGNNTITFLDEMHPLGCNPSNISATLSVFTACISIATATTGIGEILAAVSAGNAILSAIKGANQPDAKSEIGGATVPAVLSSMRNAINKVSTGIDQQEKLLVKALNNLSANLDQMTSPTIIPAPNLQAASLHDLENVDPSNPKGFRPRS